MAKLPSLKVFPKYLRLTDYLSILQNGSRQYDDNIQYFVYCTEDLAYFYKMFQFEAIIVFKCLSIFSLLSPLLFILVQDYTVLKKANVTTRGNRWNMTYRLDDDYLADYICKLLFRFINFIGRPTMSIIKNLDWMREQKLPKLLMLLSMLTHPSVSILFEVLMHSCKNSSSVL